MAEHLEQPTDNPPGSRTILPPQYDVEDGVDQGPRQSQGRRMVARTTGTRVTELAEVGAGDEVIMSIAGHVSRCFAQRHENDRDRGRRPGPIPRRFALLTSLPQFRSAVLLSLAEQRSLAQGLLGVQEFSSVNGDAVSGGAEHVECA